MLRLPDPCLVVLIGAAGSGKSTWAASQFGPWRVVAADDLRAVVGLHEHDQRASKDAFDVLERIADARLRRGFTTVLDSTGLDAKRRAAWVALARRRGVPVHAVVFDVDERQVRAWNRNRERPVPSNVVTSQLQAVAALALDDEAFDGVHRPADVELVAPRFVDAPASARAQQEDPMPLTFGLQIGGFPDGVPAVAQWARAAEDIGFTTVTVMDHLLQIPQIGPEWQDMPESWTTVGFLAGVTSEVRLGVLVTNVTLRNIAVLGKIVATADVLSGGRVICGLGAGWFDREMQLYGYGGLASPSDRLDVLEDALQLLPLLWGPGSPPFAGKTFSTPAATCYPRPVQEKVPLIVGGGGERRTLRLVATYADACNIQGDPEVVARKVSVLRAHCEDVGRDPDTVQITHLSEAAILGDDGRYAGVVGTVEEQIGRYRALADAGVTHAVVGLHHEPSRFAPVVEAFR